MLEGGNPGELGKRENGSGERTRVFVGGSKKRLVVPGSVIFVWAACLMGSCLGRGGGVWGCLGVWVGFCDVGDVMWCFFACLPAWVDLILISILVLIVIFGEGDSWLRRSLCSLVAIEACISVCIFFDSVGYSNHRWASAWFAWFAWSAGMRSGDG